MSEASERPAGPTSARRTPARQKARQLAKHLRGERPDYIYLKEVFRHLRTELDVEVQREPKRLPYVPTEAEIRRYYETVWKERRGGDVVLIKTLLYTGVRVAELVAIRLDDVDLDACRIRITQGKGGKDRLVPFPPSFKETLALHMQAMRERGASHLFESSWKKPYSTRGVRAILARYVQAAGIATPSLPTSYAISCSRGSRLRASTTRLSSPTAATPAGSHWRSTPASPRGRPGELRPGHRALPCLADRSLLCGWGHVREYRAESAANARLAHFAAEAGGHLWETGAGW